MEIICIITSIIAVGAAVWAVASYRGAIKLWRQIHSNHAAHITRDIDERHASVCRELAGYAKRTADDLDEMKAIRDEYRGLLAKINELHNASAMRYNEISDRLSSLSMATGITRKR